MKDHGKPVPTNQARTRAIAEAVSGQKLPLELDFSDTRTAFAYKTDEELLKAAWLFGLMNKHWLVGLGSTIGLAAIKLRLPFVESVVKNTIFKQFCGGTTLLNSKPTIDKLYAFNVRTVLDYGAEGKETEEDFNRTMKEVIRAIEFGAQEEAVSITTVKVTGLARFGLLESLQAGEPFTPATRLEYKSVLKRLDAICHVAEKKNVGLFIDAEESWIQDSIDHLVTVMMRRYNRKRVIVFNTIQLYRHDRLQFLFDSYQLAKRGNYKLGMKLVRGAYMEKERERAAEKGYPSPIYPNKEATDDAYNTAVRFCVDHYEDMVSCNASHNAESMMLQAQLMHERGIPADHPNLSFSQLLGMSDHLSFNLAAKGFNVSKYMPYGPVRETVPYLIRRAQENSSVTGDMSREYKIVQAEIKRRGL
jgi:proline dehydrogenase